MTLLTLWRRSHQTGGVYPTWGAIDGWSGMVKHGQNEVPLDPDVDAFAPAAAPVIPLHLRSSSIALVAFGGALGTAGREGVALALPAVGALPVATLIVNLVGALFLGVFLEALVRSGPDTGWRLRSRLLIGTGFAGGFTTYSAFATEIALLLRGSEGWVGLGYAAMTVLGGALASIVGIALGARWGRRR